MERSIASRNWTGRAFLSVTLLLLPALSHAWWNDEWKGRRQFSVDTSAAGVNPGGEPIGPTALLVRLHAGNFKLEQLKDDGSDLRAIAADDKTPLKYHIEKFDPLLGEALVWIGFPELKPGARTLFWLYFGNPKAAAGDDPKGTFDPSTVLVYHFAERGQAPRDSSNWGNHATTAGQSAEGSIIGRGLRLERKEPLVIPGGPALAWPAASPMTWSAWLKPAEADANAIVFGRGAENAALVIGLEAGKPYVEVSGPPERRVSATTPLPAQSWHHLAVVAGTKLTLYVDGVSAGSTEASLPALSGNSLLGGGTTPPNATPAGFTGELDELEISKVERSASFIRVAAFSQGADAAKMVSSGQDEQSGSWGSGYFAIILQSVTPDGWVVIALLVIMAMISWFVMASKASYLSRVERANERFVAKFREGSGELARLVERSRQPQGLGTGLQDSPLYRIFLGGSEEISKRSDGTRPLHAEAIEAIEAHMHAQLLRETQRLNRNMVLLTIAISGGPFLGLLGTVVGVMITFASIAAAGDVNVNAIAPGIAAALVATVAGLGVAIPALFGYNWLLTRIKNTTTAMQVFVDELVTKTAEAYSERTIEESRPRPPARLAAAE